MVHAMGAFFDVFLSDSHHFSPHIHTITFLDYDKQFRLLPLVQRSKY